MTKILLFTWIAISLPLITALDTPYPIKKQKRVAIKLYTTKVPDWSKVKNPKKLAYYEHLYRQQ